MFVITFSRVLDLQGGGGQNPCFPLAYLVIVTTVLRYSEACDSLL